MCLATLAFIEPLIIFSDPPVNTTGAPCSPIVPVRAPATPRGEEGGEEMMS